MSWIQTYSGKVFDLNAPTPSAVNIGDIAHALSMTCRFNGHTNRFYSVAEHCVVMSRMVNETVAFEALMHDAAEAYVSDLPRPIKLLLPDFKIIEERVLRCVYSAFGLEPGHTVAVMVADLRMLATEREQVMAECPREWPSIQGYEPYDVRLECWPPNKARAEFMGRYSELSFSQNFQEEVPPGRSASPDPVLLATGSA